MASSFGSQTSLTCCFLVSFTKFHIRPGKDGLKQDDTSVPFQLYPPTTEPGDSFGITTANLLHRVTLTLSQCMFNQTKLLRFSIWPKTCLSDSASDECFLSIHPCLTCLSRCVRQNANHCAGNCDHTSIIYDNLSIFAQSYDLIHGGHRACPAGKVHETFQTYIRVFPDLNLIFHAGLLMLLLVSSLLQFG